MKTFAFLALLAAALSQVSQPLLLLRSDCLSRI
jgi:hypothetical protein